MTSRYLSSQKPVPQRKAPPKVVNTVKSRVVENKVIQTQINLTGRLEAKDKIEVFAEVGGVLKPDSRRFREGNYFNKGQILLSIDDEEARLNLLAQKSSLLNQITLIMPDLKLDYPEAFENWQAYLTRFDVTQPLYPLPKPTTDKERYFISVKNLHNLYYSIESAEARLKKYQVRAPFSGNVSESNITDGTLVRVGQKLGEFLNTSTYELEAAVTMQDLEYVKMGNKVTLRSNDISGEWQGTVSRISDKIDPNTQTVKVFITVSGSKLKEGMYLDATIMGKEIPGVVEIPRKSILKGDNVYVIRDSVLALQKIEPQHYNTNSVLVKGLEDGMLLVNETVIGAYEGMEVKTIK
jgi:multidrug efflux pump subunit AcrA (membrane-fusion protein)